MVAGAEQAGLETDEEQKKYVRHTATTISHLHTFQGFPKSRAVPKLHGHPKDLLNDLIASSLKYLPHNILSYKGNISSLMSPIIGESRKRIRL